MNRFPVISLPTVVVLIVMTVSTMNAEPSRYSFYSKAKAYYTSEIKPHSGGSPEFARIDSLFMNPEGPADFEQAFLISWRTGLALLEKGSHARALDIFNDQRQYLESKTPKSKEDQEKIAMVYNVIGAIYEETGLWNDAMAMYMSSLQVCEATGDQAGMAKVYNNIGNLYYNRDDLVKAEELFNKAIAINSKLKIRPELFNNYNNLAGVYSRRNDPAKALEYALVALSQLDIGRDFYDVSFAYYNIGNLYQAMNKTQLALAYYQQAAEIQEKQAYQIGLSRTCLSIASLYETLHRRDSADYYMSWALALCDSINNPSQKLTVYREAARFYEKSGNNAKAYAYYARVLNLTDSLEALNSLTKLEQIQAVYEVINKEKDNQILQQKIHLQQLALQRQRIILAGAVALVLFFIYFVFTQRRNNRREREKNQMIMEQADLLHQQEKNILLNKEQSLELELDYRNRQLTSYALHLARNNEFVYKTTEELRQILLGLNPRDKEKSEQIRNMITDLNQSTSGTAWEEFRLYFEEVHQSFEKNLSSAYPDLSPNDKKICALLRLGLTTKEIASITFRELRSVESARNRLRKKLNLAPEVNIHTFLSQF